LCVKLKSNSLIKKGGSILSNDIINFISDNSIYFTAFLGALLLSILFTPFSIFLGKKLKIMDIPNERKVHIKAIPRSGGIAVFFSFFITYFFIEKTFNPFTDTIFLYFFISLFLIFILGILDDFLDLKAKTKFVVQILIALFYTLNVHSITEIHLPFFNDPIILGILSIPFTVVWIVAITNAFNLIDGLDGLSSGLATISAFTFFIVSLNLDNVIVSILAIILAGTLSGFLFFNSNPAKIFLGDSGSLFIGFLLASISVLELKQVAVTSFVTPILIFFIPISDTIYAIIRRKLKGEPIFKADKEHLHHGLLGLGFSQRKTVMLIYLFTLTLSVGAIFSLMVAVEFSVLILIIYMVLFQIIAKKIGMFPKK
jgi:UDP-GlcNAc:undecaprenyl-phosphate GlcNAc-1-phosphate transferase